MKRVFYLLLTFLLAIQVSHSQSLLTVNNNEHRYIGRHLQLLEDSSGKLHVKEVLASKQFTSSTSEVPNLKVSDNAYWLKFKVKNESVNPQLIVQLGLATIDLVHYYAIHEDGRIDSTVTGDTKTFHGKLLNRPDFNFKLSLPQYQQATILIRMKGGEQLQAPINIGSQDAMLDSFFNSDLIIGIYLGIIVVMMLYNLFVFYSTRDKSYIYYVFYIAIVGLTQLNFQGYAYKYLWTDSIFLSTYAVYILSILVAVASIEFMKQFLLTKTYTPTLHKIFPIFYSVYFIAFTCLFFSKLNLSYQIIQVNAFSAALFQLYVAWKISRLNFRPAKIFLAAWSIFLVGICVYVLKDIGVLPYNNITYYMMPLGSAIEVVLLSFALADKINLLKKEKEDSQVQVLMALQENETLIKEQNVFLEQKVNERTSELAQANQDLNVTLKDLKNTQAQLVSAEKMASLGQLTAGIAHEINNPINFVSANIKPLQMDVADIMEVIEKYEGLTGNGNFAEQLAEIESFKKKIDLEYTKGEIKTLLAGIEDGAKRTAEIVTGLKTFSRLDESDVKTANINDGIESTLTMIRSAIPENIKVIKNLGVLPIIECFPGKLNQVFMNTFNNAIHAIEHKKSGGTLTISSYESDDDHICVCVEDTGIGMTPETKAKIFEPFFTTKDVGQGTGLGMSIVFTIIESHKGDIAIDTEFGKGTKIVFTLPKKLTVS
jgi:two-component system, NtrC family, sensor kinase